MIYPSYRSARAAAGLLTAIGLGWVPAALVTNAVAPLSAGAQPARGTGRVTGQVVGDNRQPLVGAQITVQGTTIGTVSGDDGRYTLNGVAAGTQTIRVQRIGYVLRTETVTVRDGEATTLDLQLATAATQLSAVSVVGYTNEQRRDISGAVTTVTASDINDQKVATVEEALRGRAPGVQIAASGQPGRPASIVIRGQNGFGNPSPLYVVDGMYIGNQNPNINPDDIASINILKDASASAQYGAQASNGVVVITTRRGQSGPNRLTLDAYYGAQQIPKRIDVMNASQFQAAYKAAYTAAGQTAPAGVSGAASINTDWQDAIFKTGGIQNYNLSASGGTPTASYLLSGSVLDQQGTVMNTDFRRYSLRINSEATRSRFTVGENVALSQSNQAAYPNGIFGGQALPLIDVVSLLPTIPVRDPNNPGGYGYGSDANPNYGVNPVAVLSNNYNRTRSNQVLGTAYGDVRIVGGLHYRLNLGLNYNDVLHRVWTSSAQVRYLTPVLTGAALTQEQPNGQNLLYENLLNYDGTFGGGSHRISAVAGLTSQNNTFDYLSAFRQGFSNEELQQLNAGSTTGFTNNAYLIPFRTNSELARATYSFKDRYLLTGSVRHDCSTRFSPGNKCGNFGAGSVGWVVSEEGFWKSIPLLSHADQFKLRASTGVLGDQNIGDLAYFTSIAQNINYVNNGPSGATPISGGATQTTLANTDLRWQRNRSSDVGLDLGLFGDKLSFTMDYYRNDADQLLVQVPLPGSLASASNPYVNAGKVRNAGFELGATNRYEHGGFNLNTTFNLTTTANRVVSLGNGGQPISSGGFGGITRTAVGHQIGSFYLKQTCGIFQSAADVTAHKAQPGAQPGDLCFVDQNGDNTINDNDRVFIDKAIPNLVTGLFFDSKWHGWDLGLNLRGSFGNKIFNAVKHATETVTGLNNLAADYNPWTTTNPSTTTPRAVFGDAVNSDAVSDHWLESGNFVRIQNVVLGYTIPDRLLRSARLSGASSPRLYVNLQNLYTFTNYSGFDPEVLGFGDPLARGVDDGLIYPNARTLTVGVNVRF